MTSIKCSQLRVFTALFVVSVGINTYVIWPQALTALAVLGGIVLGIRVSAAFVPQAGLQRKRGGFMSLLALMVPVLGVWQMASYTNPPAPWLVLLGFGLTSLGYTLGAATVAGHFDILALGNRLTTASAAVGTFVVGTLLASMPPLTS